MKKIKVNIGMNRSKRKAVNILALMFIFILLTVFNALGNESSCVKCHTDEKTLKSLVVVPKISEEAGGG